MYLGGLKQNVMSKLSQSNPPRIYSCHCKEPTANFYTHHELQVR
jgi:hypothetical protein